MQLNFKNGYGTLTLKLVSPVMPVDAIHGADIADTYKFDLETAEKVALITENRHIQIGGFTRNDCYVVAHESTSTAAVACIESMTYVGGVPAQAIERERWRSCR